MVRLALSERRCDLDVWNTHLDAGRSDADHAARRAQLDGSRPRSRPTATARAVLVGGDFNLEWDDPRDRALSESFRDRLGLTIAAQTPPDGWESHLDYLLLARATTCSCSRIEGGKDEGDARGPRAAAALGSPRDSSCALRVE